MTDMQQALTISGAIFGAMMLTQFGRRTYHWHKVLIPLVSVATVGFSYLRTMPTDGVDWVVYGVGALVGLGFGVAAAAATGVERDARGKAWTRCGLGFVAAWFTVMALRIGFVALAEHDGAFRQHLGTFMADHGIVQDAIAPCFVVMALATVLVRLAVVAVRVHRTPAAAAVSTDAAPEFATV